MAPAAALLVLAPAVLGNETRLSNGVVMPTVGFGCAGRLGAAVLRDAIRAGYLLFDTAQAFEWYDEGALGEAIEEAGVDRRKLFLTTKIHPRDFGPKATVRALDSSLAALRTSYLDLVLLHYPRCWGRLCAGATVEGDWLDAYRVLERALTEGVVRAIGVCNVFESDLAELMRAVDTTPHVVQNWMDPYHQDRAVRALCRAQGITYEAYSALGTQHHALSANPVLDNPAIKAAAAAVGVTAAQAVLRWALDRHAVVLPRTRDVGHMRDNLHLAFALPAHLAAYLDGLEGTDPAEAIREEAAQATAGATGGGAVEVIFRNGLPGPVDLCWQDARWSLEPQRELRLTTYPGHRFWAEEVVPARAPASRTGAKATSSSEQQPHIWVHNVAESRSGDPVTVVISAMAKVEL